MASDNSWLPSFPPRGAARGNEYSCEGKSAAPSAGKERPQVAPRPARRSPAGSGHEGQRGGRRAPGGAAAGAGRAGGGEGAAAALIESEERRRLQQRSGEGTGGGGGGGSRSAVQRGRFGARGAGAGGAAMASMAAAIAASRTAVMNGNRPLDERERKRFSYFSSLSPMARKIMAEKERIRERYGPEWERLPPRQQDEIIDKCLVEPHVQARYAAHRGTARPPAAPASYPSLRLNTGQKVVRFGDEVPSGAAPRARRPTALSGRGTSVP